MRAMNHQNQEISKRKQTGISAHIQRPENIGMNILLAAIAHALGVHDGLQVLQCAGKNGVNYNEIKVFRLHQLAG